MKKIIFAVLILAVIAIGGYLYLYKGHRDIAAEKAAYEMAATALSEAFLNTPDAAVAQYLDKTIILSGKVTETMPGGITLDKVAYCEFMESTAEAAAMGKTVTVKGRCIGYDELLEIVKLDQCTVIN